MRYRNKFKAFLRKRIRITEENMPEEKARRESCIDLLNDLRHQLKFMEEFDRKGFKPLNYYTFEYMEKEKKPI